MADIGPELLRKIENAVEHALANSVSPREFALAVTVAWQRFLRAQAEHASDVFLSGGPR